MPHSHVRPVAVFSFQQHAKKYTLCGWAAAQAHCAGQLGPVALARHDIPLRYFISFFAIRGLRSQVTVQGFFMHKTSYLRNMWNVLDFFIVLIGIVGWVGMGGGNLSALRALRTFRALRPIRVASRAEGMKARAHLRTTNNKH
eukprot:3508359-Pyramimonas_sp.AAC.1